MLETNSTNLGGLAIVGTSVALPSMFKIGCTKFDNGK